MIVEPDLIYHWKFRLLGRAIGFGPAYRALFQLWGHAQTRRQWIFRLHPAKLGAICDVDCPDETLWQLMTDPESGWLVPRGTWWEIREWATLNRTMVHAWTARSAGRLPWMDDYENEVPENKGKPLMPAPLEKHGWKRDRDRSADPSPDGPLDTPNRREKKRGEKSESENENKQSAHSPLCTLEEAREHGFTLKMDYKAVDLWWHHRNASGWRKSSGMNGGGSRIHCWKSDLAASRTWAEERSGTAPPKRMTLRL
jgi:hypothetical protein